MTVEQQNNPRYKTAETSHLLAQPVIGQLTASENPGEILVICDGYEPRPAQLLSGLNRSELINKATTGQRVLVVFIKGNPDEPVIVGMMENLLEELVFMEKSPVDALVDGERVMIRAEKEIALICGEGSITITREGRIVVKGRDIISRASQLNKIKGSSVELN